MARGLEQMLKRRRQQPNVSAPANRAVWQRSQLKRRMRQAKTCWITNVVHDQDPVAPLVLIMCYARLRGSRSRHAPCCTA